VKADCISGLEGLGSCDGVRTGGQGPGGRTSVDQRGRSSPRNRDYGGAKSSELDRVDGTGQRPRGRNWSLLPQIPVDVTVRRSNNTAVDQTEGRTSSLRPISLPLSLLSWRRSARCPVDRGTP